MILSVREPEDPELELLQLPEEEMDLEDLFPDPADFVPPSPTFTFPPLPPTPPQARDYILKLPLLPPFFLNLLLCKNAMLCYEKSSELNSRSAFDFEKY